MHPLRLGIVGTGLAVEHLHLPALRHLDDLFEVRAIAGRNPDKARAFAQAQGIPEVESEAERLLTRPDLDLLLLCLPIELNATWARKALAAGKPAVAEKPIAATRAEAAALVQASEQAGASPLLIAENFLFWPHMAEAVRKVRDGSLGQPRAAVVHHAQDATLAGEWLTEWRVKPQFEGGFVLDCGVHWTALLNAMFGEPLDVVSRTEAFEPSLPPIDTSAALITYPNGLHVLWSTTFSVKAAGEALVTIHGSQGSLALFWDRTEWRNAQGDVETFTSPQGGYEDQWRYVHAVLAQGAPQVYSARQGMRDLDLMLRICGK